MKKVLFDGTATQSSSRAAFHGGGEYAKFMLKAAIKHGYAFDVVLSKRLNTDPEIEKLLAGEERITVINVNEKHEIYSLIRKGNYNVFYSALPVSYSDYSCSAKLVGVVHGLRAAELPWDFYRYKYEGRWKERVVSWIISHCNVAQQYLKQKHIKQSHRLLKIRNAQFITASCHTKSAMLAFYPELNAENIQVFYSPFTVRQIKESSHKKDYFLMVSGNRYEKNVYRAVCVFDKLFSDGRLRGKRVIITGCGNQPFWKEIKNRERFELLPYVSTDELEQLYEQAFCFVYPSLNEGFGYPPLKAMGYGTPVIASSATSIPEVCDDAACYFSPTNMDDMAARILRVSYDGDYRSMLIERGLRRVEDLQSMQVQELDIILRMIFE
jgi:glycosyltransferase involved in cell wall biosynthesis